MAYWLLKTEPSTYGFDDLERDECALWDGIHNPQALNYVRAMRTGDQVLIYHSGEQRAVVGSGSIPREPYPDSEANDPKATVVDVLVGKRVPRPVTLSTIKADPLFADSALVKQPRLSVVQLTGEQWHQLAALSGLDEA